MKLALIIVCAILNRLGGSKNKLFRRLGIPLVITAYGCLFHSWWHLLSFPIGFFAFILPITLVGDDITAHWQNYLWVFFLGILIGAQTISWLAIPYGIIFGVLVLLSNFKKTAEIFTWCRVEYLYGGLLGLIC